MKLFRPLAYVSLLLVGVTLIAPGCVVAQPHEGYYDRDNHRWYHEHAWVACNGGDEHCR
jgi:hypothetical protein